MNKKFVVHARVLKAMSDENRLRILDLLREREYNASELLDEMDFGQSTLSHHMRILLQAGAVKARKNGKWTYYLYDNLGRLTEQGECTNQSVTSNAVVQIQNYYDDYSFVGSTGFPVSQFTNDISGYGKGALTGQKVIGFNVCSPVWKAFYYDIRGREVKRVESNAMGGYDVTATVYSFTDKPLILTHTHTSSKKNLVEVYTYSYDYADRLLKVQHKLDDLGTVTLAEYGYDNLGRLNSKKLGGTAHSSAYSYNIRSWLTGITGGKFTQTLTYNNGSTGYNGNITTMNWTANGSSHSYSFSYDGLNRLLNATHGAGRFTEKVTSYDKNGNIKSLQRYGQISVSAYGLIDNLTYTLDGNRLNRVDDAATASAHNGGFEFKDGVKQADEYAYDANGNLTKDLNKGISNIQYNCLNLPTSVGYSSGGFSQFGYTADGVKRREILHTVSGAGDIPSYIVYCGNVIYEDNVAKFLLTEEGYVTLADNTYHYYVKDHQGNNRLVVNSSGTVEEVNHYYPFGGLFASSSPSVQPYKYNGKELNTKKGVNWYDYGARQYDAALGQFTTVDPLAEKYSSTNPFAYCLNNPINSIDPDGCWPFFVVTAIVGAVVGAVAGGIIAAQNGGNVLTGIGIGAASGALIGTGVGAAAGAALAGSITATTGAVVAGGGTLAATASAGGVGAGAAYVANNLAQAANNITPAAQTVASKMQDVATKGKNGELLSGLVKNTTRIPSLTGTAAYRIPDGLDMSIKVLSEVKNYTGKLSYTSQPKDFVMWSQANGFEMHLYTNAILTGPLQKIVDSGIIKLFPLK